MNLNKEERDRLLKEPLRWELQGKEKEFEENIMTNLDLIIECMGLPDIEVMEQQKVISFEGNRVILDILVHHKDGSATIFEVKKGNNEHPATATSNQMNAVGQLFLYRNVVAEKVGQVPRLVLIDNKIFNRTMKAFAYSDIPITLMELQKDRLFIPYRAY